MNNLKLLTFLNIIVVMPNYAWGETIQFNEGTTNPEEMAIVDAPFKKPSITVCQAGYYLNKMGDHDPAFQTHLNCAEAGYTGSMIWLAYVYQNGLHEDGENPEISAQWDLRAANAGSEVGMYNYGLNLLRGYGVSKNVEEAKFWIQKAAALGHKHAIELINAEYDWRVVTPDADEAKFTTD